MDLIFGDFTLTDSSDDQIRYTDTAGNLEGSCPGVILGFDGGNGTGPTDGMFSIQDIDHIAVAGNFAVVDNSDDEVVVFNILCLPEMHFDTNSLPGTAPERIAIDNVAERIYIVDSSTDEVYELDMPQFFEATTLSGSFISGTGVALNLKETGDGFIAGEVILPGGASVGNLFGVDVRLHGTGADVAAIFNSSALTIDVMTDLGAGAVTFSGTVGADLNSVTLGGITLNRQ
jgi:hypothetical protein